jgi:hypothetical protein
MFPITIAQTLWDADFDREFSSLKSFWWRGCIGFGLTLIGTQLMARASETNSLLYVSCLALCLGTASGILHGTLKQMASFVYPGCGRLAAAVTAGLQASALFVLLVSVLTARVPNKYWLYVYYGSISMLVLACWLGFQRLMTHSQDIYQSMIRRDSSIQLAGVSFRDENNNDSDDNNTGNNGGGDEQLEESTCYQPLLSDTVLLSESASFGDEPESNVNSSIPRNNMPSMRQLLYQIWPLCLATFLTVASSMAVASWFNRVPSTHPNLPQVLFYTRLFADLLARPTTLLLPTATDDDTNMANVETSSDRSGTNNRALTGLVSLTLFRLLFVPYFFWYTDANQASKRGDILMVLGVFGFAFSSGFVTTWVYQLAPRYCLNAGGQVSSDNSIILQQTNYLNVWFSGSMLFGVVGSLILTSMKTSTT